MFYGHEILQTKGAKEFNQKSPYKMNQKGTFNFYTSSYKQKQGAINKQNFIILYKRYLVSNLAKLLVETV